MERTKNGSAMEQFKRERLVVSDERLGLPSRPNHVDADDFSEPPTSSKADRNEESEGEGKGVCQIFCAVPNENVKIDIIRRNIPSSGCGSRKRDAIDERARPQQLIREFQGNGGGVTVRRVVHDDPRARFLDEPFLPPKANKSVGRPDSWICLKKGHEILRILRTAHEILGEGINRRGVAPTMGQLKGAFDSREKVPIRQSIQFAKRASPPNAALLSE
jgi:hypothetical protein